MEFVALTQRFWTFLHQTLTHALPTYRFHSYSQICHNTCSFGVCSVESSFFMVAQMCVWFYKRFGSPTLSLSPSTTPINYTLTSYASMNILSLFFYIVFIDWMKVYGQILREILFDNAIYQYDSFYSHAIWQRLSSQINPFIEFIQVAKWILNQGNNAYCAQAHTTQRTFYLFIFQFDVSR